jgi:hypothetical protein
MLIIRFLLFKKIEVSLNRVKQISGSYILVLRFTICILRYFMLLQNDRKIVKPIF